MSELKQNSRVAELGRNTMIIAVANIGSKAIAFILAPLYSFYLTVEQYGTMDLIVTTVGLIVPFFCLDIFEATFRYASDKNYDGGQTLSSSLLLCLPGTILEIISLVLSLLFCDRNTFKIIAYLCAYVLLSSLNNILSSYLRGKGRMIGYAFSGVVNSIVLLASNIVFLVFLKKQLDGWLISYLIAFLATNVYLVVLCYNKGTIKNSLYNRVYIKEFLRYCLPLMPATIMWWIMSASDRYMLRTLSGAYATGLYSAAGKLPAILSILEYVFYQAWQTTAINSINDKDRNTFYSDVLGHYYDILTIAVIGMTLIGKLLLDNLFNTDYAESWICLSPLFLAVMVHALAGNLGSLYTVFKDTKGALYTTIIGAGTNIVLNLLLIPHFGASGAAYTTLTGYLVTLIVRWFNVKKFVTLDVITKKRILYLLFIIANLLLSYDNSAYSYILRSVLLLTVLSFERKTIGELLGKVINIKR